MSAKQHYPLLVKKHHIMTLHHSIPINKPGSISPSRATMATCREKSEVKKNCPLMQKILYQLAIKFPKKSTNSISQNYCNEQEMKNLLLNYFFISYILCMLILSGCYFFSHQTVVGNTMYLSYYVEQYLGREPGVVVKEFGFSAPHCPSSTYTGGCWHLVQSTYRICSGHIIIEKLLFLLYRENNIKKILV